MSRNTAYLSNIYLFRLTQFYSGHLDVVNYFFPIRLNVLIVMGLGLFKCGLGLAQGRGFLGGPEPNFWRRAKAQAGLEPDIWGRAGKFELLWLLYNFKVCQGAGASIQWRAQAQLSKPGPVLLGPDPHYVWTKIWALLAILF